MIIAKISDAPANRPVCGLPDGTYEVWAEGEPQPAWYQVPIAAAPVRAVSAAEFRDKFTAAELAGISAFAYSGVGDISAQMLLLKIYTNRDGVDLDSAEVIAGLNYLVSKGKLTTNRMAEILA